MHVFMYVCVYFRMYVRKHLCTVCKLLQFFGKPLFSYIFFTCKKIRSLSFTFSHCPFKEKNRLSFKIPIFSNYNVYTFSVVTGLPRTVDPSFIRLLYFSHSAHKIP